MRLIPRLAEGDALLPLLPNLAQAIHIAFKVDDFAQFTFAKSFGLVTLVELYDLSCSLLADPKAGAKLQIAR